MLGGQWLALFSSHGAEVACISFSIILKLEIMFRFTSGRHRLSYFSLLYHRDKNPLNVRSEDEWKVTDFTTEHKMLSIKKYMCGARVAMTSFNL